MSEEEEGFTFVDKRRSAADSVAATETSPSASVTELPADTPEVFADEDASEVEGPPDIYSLIGYCLSLLQADAWQKMGLLADPQTGQASVDLAQAKVAIDAVGDFAKHLEAAPPEAVPDSLRRDLRTLLNDLRLNFVSQQNKPA